jgi:hypothetical protein
MGELGAEAAANPEWRAVEPDHAPEKVKNSVIELVVELARETSEAKTSTPLLLCAAEELASHYAVECFETGRLTLIQLDTLIEILAGTIGGLRKVLRAREEKTTRAANAVDRDADLLKSGSGLSSRRGVVNASCSRAMASGFRPAARAISELLAVAAIARRFPPFSKASRVRSANKIPITASAPPWALPSSRNFFPM